MVPRCREKYIALLTDISTFMSLVPLAAVRERYQLLRASWNVGALTIIRNCTLKRALIEIQAQF